MKRPVLLDTGPIVAYLNRQEYNHAWAQDQWAKLEPPLLTCEAVLTEACFLVSRAGGEVSGVLDLMGRGVVRVPFRLEEEVKAVAALMARYANVPMSLADACLVRMAEQDGDSVVLTLDRDFKLYRKNGRQVIPAVMPDL